jgi:hypothetical protein
MSNEELDELKKAYVDNIKKHIVETGGMFSHIALFGNKRDNNEKGIVHIVVQDEHMSSGKSKENYFINVLPGVAKDVKKVFKLDAVAWTSEAWMRTAKSDFQGDWQDLPIKKEVLIIQFQNKEECETLIFEIKRDGKVVNGDGEMVDNVSITEIHGEEGGPFNKNSAEGRMTDVLKVFIE